MPSLSGTTKESIAALEYCRQRGARVVALIGHADTPLGRGADHALVNFAEDDTSSESFYLQSLLLALSILRRRGASVSRIARDLKLSERHVYKVLAQLRDA